MRNSMLKRALLTVVITGIVSIATFSQEKEYFVACVGFYNLENLFDTINSPDTRDTEFTPEGDSRWTAERYHKKLNDLGKVISMIGTDITPDGPAVLGISEIENRDVVEDLIQTDVLKPFGFEIIHRDSPDKRGIDVGMIYQPKYFTPTNVKSVPLVIEEDSTFITRDQLVVSGDLAGEEVHFIIVHWPSRRGGEKRSKPFRNAAGDLSRKIIDSLKNINAEAKVVIMGDFNDNPGDDSMIEHLKSTGKKRKLEEGMLFNPMTELYKKGIGTTAWRDSWSLFDQILLSKPLTNGPESGLSLLDAFVFNRKFLVQPEGRFEGYPWRTFAGGVYLEGYSDHFPVYCFLYREI